jgi:transcriptional regulator
MIRPPGVTDEAIENYMLTESLGRLIRAGEKGMSSIPRTIVGAIHRRAWENIFCHPTKQLIHFNSIVEWIRAKPPEGLDTTVEVIEALIKSSQNTETLELFQRLVLEAKPPVSAKPGPKRKADPAKVMELRNQGMTQNEVAKALNIGQARVAKIEAQANIPISDNITNRNISPKTRDRGTSKDYHDRRLKKEAPELIAEIGPGKRFKTSRAALVHIGKINPPIQIVPSTPRKVAEALRSKLPGDFLAEVVAILTELMTSTNGGDQ